MPFDLDPGFKTISDERLTELYARIKPVVRKDDELYFIKDVHPRNIAFTLHPEITHKPEKPLIKLTTIKTKHGCGYILFFKPSIDEVLACIPDELLQDNKTVAFEINKKPIQMITDNGNYHHTAQTTLYTYSSQLLNEKDNIETEEEIECFICMDAIADTLVLPCYHQCVCRSCSEKLKNSNDKYTCIQCRNVITEVLQDEVSK